MAEDWEREWEAQMGGVPPFLRELREMSPAAETAYRQARADIYRERPGGLTTAEKELALLVMNITLANLDGARNHMRLARAAGLSVEAIREVLAQCMLYLGVISHVRIGQVLWRECAEALDEGGE